VLHYSNEDYFSIFLLTFNPKDFLSLQFLLPQSFLHILTQNPFPNQFILRIPLDPLLLAFVLS